MADRSLGPGRPLRIMALAAAATFLGLAAAANAGVLGDVQRSAVRAQAAAVQATAGDRPSEQARQMTVKPQGTLERGVLYQAALPPAQEQLIQAEFAKRLPESATPVILLPGVLRQEAQDGQEVVLKPLIMVGQALTRSRDGSFTGWLLVGVKEVSDARSGARALTAPVQFDVLETTFAEPASVLVTTTAPPFTRIRVTSTQARDVRLRVASRFDPEGVEVIVPVDATLNLIPSTTEIDGFGLEAADLNVNVVGLPNPKGQRVTLSVSGDAGYLEASRLILDETGAAATRVRSSGLGPMTITASVAGVEGATQIKSRFPALTLMAAAFGALVGGLIQLLSEGRQLGRRRAMVALAVSLLTGVLVFALYAVGVNVLPVSPTVSVGAVLVFAVSGLGAYLGTRLLRFGTTGP